MIECHADSCDLHPPSFKSKTKTKTNKQKKLKITKTFPSNNMKPWDTMQSFSIVFFIFVYFFVF